MRPPEDIEEIAGKVKLIQAGDGVAPPISPDIVVDVVEKESEKNPNYAYVVRYGDCDTVIHFIHRGRTVGTVELRRDSAEAKRVIGMFGDPAWVTQVADEHERSDVHLNTTLLEIYRLSALMLKAILLRIATSEELHEIGGRLEA